MFHDVLFPSEEQSKNASFENKLFLRQLIRSSLSLEVPIRDSIFIIFDLETTGLDPKLDYIIEIGAQKFKGFELIDEFSTLIRPVDEVKELTKHTMTLTGLTIDMLQNSPRIESVLPRFLQFIQDGILVAHNADFDFSFIKEASTKIGIDLDWPCYCTIKLSKMILPELQSRNLDALANHFGFTFEARHRSIGDVKVTAEVMKAMLNNERAHGLQNWIDLQQACIN